MNPKTRRILFLLFFFSGFAGLLYQLVWTRLAFAAFGIITPVLSVVISVFMFGLSVGAWGAGKLVGPLQRKTGASAIMFYAVAEFMIAVGAFAVPRLFPIGERLLLSSGQTDSIRYLILSAVVLAISILPWCLFMGATFPLMMAYIREQESGNKESFSFLYLANVLGAMTGTLLTGLVLIEVFGFQITLRLAAAMNIAISAAGFFLGRHPQPAAAAPLEKVSEVQVPVTDQMRISRSTAKWILFSTGFCGMAMEVIWTRAFIPTLKTQVYSFAMILFVYLGATFAGSLWYRRDLRNGRVSSVAQVISLMVTALLLPILINDPRFLEADAGATIHFPSAILLLSTICPLCVLLGYLTPSLIDGCAAGDPEDAGKVYAVNVIGCILGPLFASYVMLPHLSERNALLLLSLPCAAYYLWLFGSLPRDWRLASASMVALVAAGCLLVSRDFDTVLRKRQKSLVIRRDYAATVVSYGEGRAKELLVNGIGMTKLTPITKFMVHLPLALNKQRPESVLIICFGMGTTFRAALSWDVNTTAVELVPSVKESFGFFHADAAECLRNPKGRVIIDDGRRYLKRTDQKFDAIVIDPPPPVEAAGSSLLYSEEFYALAKQHLKPNGILQAWYPGGDLVGGQAVVRSISNSFPHVRCFPSIEGWGIHFLASMEPIEIPPIEQMVARMPDRAKKDLLEWDAPPDVAPYLEHVLTHEVQMSKLMNPDPDIRITDDQPFNEYFLLRRCGW